jgi:hypothetical protein
MSVIAATTLREKASALDIPVDIVRQGVAKVWALVDQTGTQAITNDLGVTSITDGGAGITDFTFTTAFGTVGYTYNGNSAGANTVGHSGTYSTTAIRLVVYNTSAVGADSSILSVSLHGNLA